MKMKRLKKSHLVLIIFSVLILSGCIGITAFLLFSNHQNVRLFKQAQNNFQRGDAKSLDLAELQLQQLVRTDDDNEAAYIMLGEIAARRKVYPELVYYSYMAHRLNPLSEENKARYVRSLCMARDFDRLENFLSQQTPLPDAWKPFLLYAAGRNGSLNKYKYLFDKKEKISKLADSKIWQLVEVMYVKADLSIEKKLKVFPKLPEDDFEKQEYLASLAELYIDRNKSENIDKAEQALQAAYKINPYAFAPALGRFYANLRSFKQALPFFEKHLATYHDPVIALQTAEIYCLLKKSSEIEKLRKHYQSDSGSRAMMICYYFDALLAMARNDFAALKELIIPLRKSINTPLAMFIFFCSDIFEKDITAIQESYVALISSRDYLDLQRRADDMLSGFLKRTLPEMRGSEEKLLTLANLLYRRKKEPFTAKLILLNSRKQRSMDAGILKDALDRFPADQGILKIAIEYYITLDPAAAERLIARFKQKFAYQSGDMFRYEIVLASKKKDFDQVSKLFKNNLSPAVLPAYWEFAASNGREDDLRFLSREKLYEPFCKALLLLKKGDAKSACDILEKADAGNNHDLLFFAARTLAENGRNHAALKKYAAMPANSPYQLAVMMNTAELFAENGDIERALELAAKAYHQAPDLPETQLCYADKLHKTRQFAKIPDVVRLVGAVPFRKKMEQLWIIGMHQRIQDCEEHNQKAKMEMLRQQLKRVAPNDPVANAEQNQNKGTVQRK